ncbi:MAG: sensor histidine kinase [Rhodanobacter sp.]|nr:MAG: sensor histidine kinase [Rhodanobacter sp.]TAM41109.1 MAG: sensor histidine kinase [Rhodanobacter sp.]
MVQRITAFFTPAPDSLAAASIHRGKSPWIDAVHLLWSAWLFATPIWSSDGWNGRWLVFTLASYPLFLLLYYKSVVAPRTIARSYALAMVLLSIALVSWYPSGLTYFIYGCVMLRVCRMPFRTYLVWLTMLNAALLLETWLLHYPWQAVFSIPLMSFIIGIVVNAERTSEEKDAQLQLSHDEVRRLAATAERERIGRDLHDLLGHTLSLITLKLELSRKLFDRDVEAAQREVGEAEKVARHALAEVRSAVSGIRASDLAAELAAARLMLESSGVSLQSGYPPDHLPKQVECGLSLVLREAVTNIARHARASVATIELQREHASVRMDISDNGRGGIHSEGNGMSGMRERVRALGGSLTVKSPRGGGTRLQVLAPIPVLRLVQPTSSPGEAANAAQQARPGSEHSTA